MNLRGTIELFLTYIKSIISFSCPEIVAVADLLFKMIVRSMSFLAIICIRLLIAQVEPKFSIPCIFIIDYIDSIHLYTMYYVIKIFRNK